jgi:membrane protein
MATHLSRRKKPIGWFGKMERDGIFFLASGLAFNFLICFIPLLIVLLAIMGFFLHSSQEILNYIRFYVEKMLPYASPRLTENILNLVRDRKIIGLIGFLGLLWTATRLFASIRTVLDKTLETDTPHGYFKGKLFDLLMVLVTGVLFLLSMVLTGLADLLRTLPERFGVTSPNFFPISWGGLLISIGVGYLFSVLMFFFLFRFSPSRRPGNRSALFTSLIVAGLWDLAKYFFRLYVEFIDSFTAVYGSLGLLVVFILWIYYSCLFFVLGGEIVWLLERGKRT